VLTTFFVAAVPVEVPDGNDPLNKRDIVLVTEWYHLPAMHGPTLRHAAVDSPFRFVTPDQLGAGLITRAFKNMGIHQLKLGTKTMAFRMAIIRYLTEQHSGQFHMFYLSWTACAFAYALLILICIAAPNERMKEGTGHVMDKSALEGTYTSRLCKQIKLLAMVGGYAGKSVPYDAFKWQQHFVQGRQLVTWEYMRATWPAEFEKIVDGLLPGMLGLLQQVEQRGLHELSREESRVSAHVFSTLFFMAAFLQLSAWKLYEYPDSPIYMNIPLFREDWFKAFHLEQYCPKVRGLQHMAEAVSEHILNPNNSHDNVVIRARQQLGIPFGRSCTTAQSTSILTRAYSLAKGEAVSDADLPMESLAASASAPAPLSCAGAHRVALPSADTLRCWWHVWQEGDRGYQPLCDYYSQTKPKVGRPEFLNRTKDPQKVWRRQHMLWELEKQIGQGHQTKKENADKVIKRWDALIATEACGIRWSVAKLAQCFRALATTQLEMLVTDPACKVDEPEKCKANVAREAFVKAFVQ